MALTPEELVVKLRQANEDYHENLDAIMLSDDIEVNVKVRVGAFANNLFQLMTEINDYLTQTLL